MPFQTLGSHRPGAAVAGRPGTAAAWENYFRNKSLCAKISCGHEAHFENDLMWRLHAERGCGVALRTTVEILGEPSLQPAIGHSVGVVATPALLALNVGVASVMQAGRWTTTAMPMRDGEHQSAARVGMARSAKEQGRD